MLHQKRGHQANYPSKTAAGTSRKMTTDIREHGEGGEAIDVGYSVITNTAPIKAFLKSYIVSNLGRQPCRD